MSEVDRSADPVPMLSTTLSGDHLMSAEDLVRSALVDWLSTDVSTNAIFSEFWIPVSKARADVALLGANLSAFEIKTEKDSLKRLPSQASAYASVFSRCGAVVAERHLAGALDILPDWWSIIVIAPDQQPRFQEIRRGWDNPAIDTDVLVRLLWRAEVAYALGQLGEPTNPDEGRFALWQRLLKIVSATDLMTIVVGALQKREASTQYSQALA